MEDIINIDKEEAKLILRKLEYNWKKNSNHPIIIKLLDFVNEGTEDEEKFTVFTKKAKKANK